MLIAFNALTIEGNSPAEAADPPMILTFGTPAPSTK